MFRRRFRLIAVAVIIFVAALAYYVIAPGVRINIRNTGRERMNDVAIHVTGHTYSLGDIAPGASRTERVFPEADSQIEVVFKDKAGSMMRLVAGGHVEPSSRGEIDIEVKDGKIMGVKSELHRGIVGFGH
jgi:hypothetical protein